MACTILFLSAKPGIDMLTVQNIVAHGCCGGDCEPNDNTPLKEDKGCEGKSCNPFQICSASVLFFSMTPYSFIAEAFISESHSFSYYEDFISYFSYDFWHPPQIV